MLNPTTNAGKLRNDVLMTLFAYFQNGLQNHGNITEIFYFLTILFFLSEIISMVLSLEYMVLAENYMIMSGYYRIHGYKYPFNL